MHKAAVSLSALLVVLLSLGCRGEPVCQNGKIEKGEECDDGNSAPGDNCDPNCTLPRCGNSVVSKDENGLPEVCDDGNTISEDGCDTECFPESCGDSLVQEGIGEECDDGNQDNTDSCPDTCQSAFCGDNFIRAGVEACDDGNNLSGDGCRLDCLKIEVCGDGVVDVGEECDDQSQGTAGDCVNCRNSFCGDGFVEVAIEECDDGNNVDRDGCEATCSLSCGNGIIDVHLNEICDDGNHEDEDGCSNNCAPSFQVIQVVASTFHTCVLLDTGNIRCWGLGNSGQLGYGNTNTIGDNEIPASAGNVDIGGTAIQVTAGTSYTCALLNTGNVRCWGNGFSGKLGYGNSNNIGDDETPASAGDVNIGGTVIQISAGSSHTCALLDTGNVRCWGDGSNGQLGYGDTDTIGDNETPASAGNVDIGGTVVQISAGGTHTCALLDGGNVRCWGRGTEGQLGYGNTSTIGDNETPASAGNINIGGIVTQISAGDNYTCALLNTGNVRCWGLGGIDPFGLGIVGGWLGYGNTNNIGDDEVPAVAGDVNVGGTIIQISTSSAFSNIVGIPSQHTCALLNTGSIRCWGLGLLGYQNINTPIGDNETPASAGNIDIGGTVIQVSTGGSYSCALLGTGNVRCWGGPASFGELGYGNTNSIGSNESPASAGNIGIGGTVLQVSGSGRHTCALLDSGNVRCWGDGGVGQLGYGNTDTIGDNEIPLLAGDVDVGGSIIQISANIIHTCVLLGTKNVRCWGDGNSGQLGYSNIINIGDNETPSSAGDIIVGNSIAQISSGEEHTCALLSTGAIRCWGLATSGQLGYGNTNNVGDNETPASAGNIDIGGVSSQISTGRFHTCSLLDDGNVRCWGLGGSGRLGYGNTNNIGDDEVPASVGSVNIGGVVVQISAGGAHTCALLDDGNVRCWGRGTEGQLGYGNTNNIGDNEAPASAGNINLGGSAVQISAGFLHTCALLDTRDVRCWGDGGSGQLGYGNTNNIGDNETPASAGNVDVGGTIMQISTGISHTCAVLNTGKVRCWGGGALNFGQLGYGNTNTIGDNETPASAGDVIVFNSPRSECGDGFFQPEQGEVCEDSNLLGGDGCSTQCRSEACGDGAVDLPLGEECDDGNVLDGDGCSSLCLL